MKLITEGRLDFRCYSDTHATYPTAAERVGLEPTNPLTEITVFETVRIAIPCTSPPKLPYYTSIAGVSQTYTEATSPWSITGCMLANSSSYAICGRGFNT